LKKIKLTQENSVPEFIIGISSQHYDFQVAWLINNVLGRSLSKSKSISIRLKKDNNISTYSFSLFSYSDLDNNFFYLLSNKEELAILYPKYKNIDYFLIVKSNEISIDDVIKNIKGKDFIIGSFIIPVNNVFKKIITRVFEN